MSLDTFDFSPGNLILLMGALMLTFGINRFINGVWEAKKSVISAAIEQGGPISRHRR